jgi:hypothetical protein
MIRVLLPELTAPLPLVLRVLIPFQTSAVLHFVPHQLEIHFSVVITTKPEPTFMGVWQGVAMDSLKFHPGLPCPTFLRPAGRRPLKRPAHRACGLRPSSTPLDTPRRTPLPTFHDTAFDDIQNLHVKTADEIIAAAQVFVVDEQLQTLLLLQIHEELESIPPVWSLVVPQDLRPLP